MLASISFFLASAGAEAAEHAAASESLPVKFGLSINAVAMQVISFAILAFVAYRWFIKPVLATMDER